MLIADGNKRFSGRKFASRGLYVTMSLVRQRNALASYTLAVALLFAPVLLWCAENPSEGQPIAQILFPPDQPLDPQELGDILEEQGIKKGAPFHQSAVRAAIQRLFRTGRFADIQVNAEPSEKGVELQFLTKNAWFIGHVGVEGNISDPPNPGQLANAAGLELGTPFNAADLGAADARVLRLLIANGFYDAEVSHRVDYLDIAQQVKITFRVDSGKRARYTTPQIDGTDLILSVKKIIKATGWHRFLVPGWRNVTQKRTSEGVRKVRLRYDKAGRLLATVELSGMEYDELKRELKPALNINAGPKVEVKTIGHKIRSGKLKNNVPIYEEHSVDRDLLQEGANNLRDVLQASGYFDAVVEYRERPITSDKEEIDYVINAGKRHRFVALDIEGNRYFTLKTLRERMFLQPKSFQFRRGRFINPIRKRAGESKSNK
jgi:outer membrane protein insertion porin family